MEKSYVVICDDSTCGKCWKCKHKDLSEKIDRIIAWIEDVKENQDMMSISQMEGLLESIKGN